MARMPRSSSAAMPLPSCLLPRAVLLLLLLLSLEASSLDDIYSLPQQKHLPDKYVELLRSKKWVADHFPRRRSLLKPPLGGHSTHAAKRRQPGSKPPTCHNICSQCHDSKLFCELKIQLVTPNAIRSM
ncbi:hypothetical protein GOP47_0014545 [Adiantum capillus-veneris]|uniref:Uncharacterized protein n=1 Tax=Adiantum capillus-veneris TaxID=13818 RepID=A0A9D4UM00_ADICA|nr:hypothetical protein GOP47_0014545 [Adiantum capillus-veneris]